MRPLAFGFTLALAVSLTFPVLAVPPDVQQRADEMFQQARGAMDQGDFRKALDILRASHQLDPTRGKLVNIAVCEERLGMVASALAHIREVDPQIPKNDLRRPIVDDYLVKLPPRVPTLRVTLAAGAPPDTRLTLDGEPFDHVKLSTDLPVNPGAHRLVVTAPGRQDQRFDVTLEEGKKSTLEVRAGAESTSIDSNTGAGASSRSIAPGIILAGVGALGIGTGIGLVVARQGKISEALDRRKEIDVDKNGGGDCVPGAANYVAERCAQLAGLTSAGDLFGSASIVSFVIGGLAIVGTVVYFVWPSQSPTKTSSLKMGWAPMVGPREQGLSVWGSF